MSKASATDEDNLHAEPIHNNMSDFDTDNDELGSSNDAPLILDYASPHHETGADNPQTAELTRIAPIIEDTQNANLSDRMQPMDSDRVVMNAEYQQQNLETNLLVGSILRPLSVLFFYLVWVQLMPTTLTRPTFISLISN
jgi:hypothetical protein